MIDVITQSFWYHSIDEYSAPSPSPPPPKNGHLWGVIQVSHSLSGCIIFLLLTECCDIRMFSLLSCSRSMKLILLLIRYKQLMCLQFCKPSSAHAWDRSLCPTNMELQFAFLRKDNRPPLSKRNRLGSTPSLAQGGTGMRWCTTLFCEPILQTKNKSKNILYPEFHLLKHSTQEFHSAGLAFRLTIRSRLLLALQQITPIFLRPQQSNI